jgi:hypothetical protein
MLDHPDFVVSVLRNAAITRIIAKPDGSVSILEVMVPEGIRIKTRLHISADDMADFDYACRQGLNY